MPLKNYEKGKHNIDMIHYDKQTINSFPIKLYEMIQKQYPQMRTYLRGITARCYKGEVKYIS